MYFQVIVEQTLRGLLVQADAVTSDNPVFTRKTSVLSNKVASRNTIAIDEDEILVRGCSDGFVQNDRLPEALVFMPYVLKIDRLSARKAINTSFRFGTRSIVRNDQLECVIPLMCDAIENEPQEVGPVVGADDE